jgi:integrase
MPTKTPPQRALCACKQTTCLWCFYGLKYSPRALRSRQPNTRKLYGVTLRAFGRFVERKPKLSDLNDETVGDYVAWRLDNGASAATVNRDLINLLAIWRWAHKKHYLKNWPDVELERVPKRTPRAFTMEELEQVLESAQKESRPVGGVPGGDWWTALILTCFDTGERIGAVRRLTWDQVDLRRGFVTFLAEHRKGGHEDSTKDIDADTVAVLKRLPRVEDAVFPWPYSENYIWSKLSPILTRAGLPTTRVFKFHCVRRSTASYIEAAGGNATDFFGHSKRSVTLRYIDPRIAKQRSQLHLLPRPRLKK